MPGSLQAQHVKLSSRFLVMPSSEMRKSAGLRYLSISVYAFALFLIALPLASSARMDQSVLRPRRLTGDAEVAVIDIPPEISRHISDWLLKVLKQHAVDRPLRIKIEALPDGPLRRILELYADKNVRTVARFVLPHFGIPPAGADAIFLAADYCLAHPDACKKGAMMQSSRYISDRMDMRAYNRECRRYLLEGYSVVDEVKFAKDEVYRACWVVRYMTQAAN
jgi:hypothetical protein